MKKSQAVCDWLLGLDGAPNNCARKITEAHPVIVRINKEEFEGALYCTEEMFAENHRAVFECGAKVGDKYNIWSFYLLGTLPKCRRRSSDKVVFVYPNTLPLNTNVWRSIGAWFVAGYLQDSTKAKLPYHPFGIHFILSEWHLWNAGAYKDQEIDFYDDKKYTRVPIEVRLLDQ